MAVSSEAKRNVTLGVCLTILSSLSVGLRLLARHQKRLRLAADDYWAIICAVLNLPFLAVYLNGDYE